METITRPTGELFERGKALLSAAMDYWLEYHKAGLRGAVVWLSGDDGSLVVMTRGEYADDLKATVSRYDFPSKEGGA
jgi:hypothetical protein